ncbi:hypothetical protein PNEG_02927 [Pneumocystis murina B123]|uniref:t-SNARE coiled-coil homology domain-containing protein n=1 Tax=Pneumocystis murina (strain B123) TaxID=1069680 RepID=M7P4L3_PNEMU|nr:hypothetical protein PNEG_02927 [Pneumocystis murina B123]EMR08755.1 hypothetical protein PNEG_02927 [Pneumocystis murina B123]
MIPSIPIYEQQNDRRLKELESKVSMLKDITLDIHKQASDMTMIEQSKQAISRLTRDVHNSALRLNRVLLTKISIFKCWIFLIL